jgi:hypothetical protein
LPPLEHCCAIFCRSVHPVLAAQLRDRHTAFGLAQDRKDLGSLYLVIFNKISSDILPRKFYFRIPLVSGGITDTLTMAIITIKDRPCGYGKSTEMLASFKPDEKYVVVLPFLSEVDRATKEAPSQCGHVLYAPTTEQGNKTDHCSDVIKAGKSVACTHTLFPRLGTLATEVASETSVLTGSNPDLSDAELITNKQHLLDDYNVIIDEAINPFDVVD